MIDYDSTSYQTDTPIICLAKYYQMILLISSTNSAILRVLRNFGLDDVIVTSSSLSDTPKLSTPYYFWVTYTVIHLNYPFLRQWSRDSL